MEGAPQKGDASPIQFFMDCVFRGSVSGTLLRVPDFSPQHSTSHELYLRPVFTCFHIDAACLRLGFAKVDVDVINSI